jgi:hypothetical protein
MSDDVQVNSNEPDKVDDPQPPTNGAETGSHVLPYEKRPEEPELYSFRGAIAEPEPAGESEPQKAKSKPKPKVLLVGLAAVLAAVALALLPKLTKPTKPPALYVDMGARRFDPAGLSGRLIVRWEGSTAYRLYVDPIDQGQMAEFQAVAEDPPHSLSVTIRLYESSGVVVCQKEIVFPAPAQQAGAPDDAQALLPRQTATGDTVENVAGADGQIAEITVSGGLSCSQQEYRRLAGWDFSTNFPGVGDQEEWLRHENALAGGKQGSKGGRGAPLQVQRLQAPIEGDDVIVGDNPPKGTVTTAGGRVFSLGASGLRNRAPEWQVFPAAVHFRCDKNGACVLTRSNSRTVLQARLMR